jgi:hypothetical protein
VLCDFSGSGTDGLAPIVDSQERYSHSRTLQMDYIHGPEDDVFDMGTLLYGIFFEERLFHNLMDSQIRRNIAEGKFPDLSIVAVPLRNVIDRCWRLRGYKASEAMTELSMLSTCSHR